MLACAMLASLAGCASNSATDSSAASGGELVNSADIGTGAASGGELVNSADIGTGAASEPETAVGGSSADDTAPTATAAPTTTAAAVDRSEGETGAFEDFDIVADSATGDSFDVMTKDDYASVDGFGGAEAPTEGVVATTVWDDEYIEEPYIQPEAGMLTGGEWNDNENWNAWVSLYQTHEEWEFYREEWQIDFDVRHEVIVTAFGKPLEGAKVTQRGCGDIGVTSAVTDNEGKAYLFLDECGDDMEHVIDVTYGEVNMTIEGVDPAKSGTYTVDFENSSLTQGEVDDSDALELMLMIDTTGSMWDELQYLQQELKDVITRVKQENANIPIRVSVNFYRDEGDDYVIREFDFTEDIESALSDLAAQEADGGGDFPEAVHTALDSAVKGHEWKSNATKLMFFVLDAPPHSDMQIIDQVNDRVEIAAANGIRIIPVASSGIDKTTEYLLRTMAFRTGGTYTFLTDDSGIGGGHIEPTIGDYEVEKLNDLMVRVIGEYLQ